MMTWLLTKVPTVRMHRESCFAEIWHSERKPEWLSIKRTTTKLCAGHASEDPDRNRQSYQIGEWVMLWQPQKTGTGYWFGPAKIVQIENQLSIWATMGGRLHRRALEHVRPVCSSEARADIRLRSATHRHAKKQHPARNSPWRNFQ